MSAMSDYIEDKFLDHNLGTTTYSKPTVYASLYTDSPTDADTGTEVTGGSYARQTVTYAAASGGSASTNATITYPQATGSWGTITHFGLHDALTNGNLLFHGALDVSKTITTGDVFTISSGNLTVTAD